MVASNQERMSSAVSTATLDLQDVLSSFNGDCLVSLRLSISASDSIHSFDNIPPFPTKTNPVAFVSDFKNKCQPSRGTHRPSGDVRSIVTLPTAPRRKALLTEKIDIHAWKVSDSSKIRARLLMPCSCRFLSHPLPSHGRGQREMPWMSLLSIRGLPRAPQLVLPPWRMSPTAILRGVSTPPVHSSFRRSWYQTQLRLFPCPSTLRRARAARLLWRFGEEESHSLLYL